MKVLASLLLPFAVLYDAITSIRNRLYDSGTRPSAKFEIPVVGVGNLAVGGTGKTPMVEYLIRLFAAERKIATLSRGYGRRTKGIRIAGLSDTPATVGDEPYQMYRKFGEQAVIAVGEERALAIPYVLAEYPETSLIILDDAFQHRRVTPSIQILLTDCHRPFFSDWILPAGRLRESRRGARRADVIVVTKCSPNMTDEETIAITHKISRYSDKPVFFSTIGYKKLVRVAGNAQQPTNKVVLLSAIANPKPFETYVSRNHRLVAHLKFPDHHEYTSAELESACDLALSHGAVVVTTEKDIVKIDANIFERGSVGLYYLPIEMELLKNGKEFDELIRNAVSSYAG